MAWVMVYLVRRTPFIASFVMIAVLALGNIIACDHKAAAVAGSIITALFIIFNHRNNIEEFLGRKEKEEPSDKDEG
jgi:acyl phosphate:glycerol-3-phosphate acyltransferase